MRTSVRLCSAAAVSAAGLMMVAGPAFADSAGNNGINVLNDNKVSVAPVQVCGNGITADVLSDLISPADGILSPHTNNCATTPIVDHAN